MKEVHFLFISALITTATFAQNTEDTTDHRFHDDLREHLVIIQKKVHVRLPGSSL